jgi:glycosyltransferase involved in cell wall biosynthesis
MIVLNEFVHDARVEKEATTLIQAGYRVTVIARRINPALAEEENKDGIAVRRVSIAPHQGRTSLVARAFKVLNFYMRLIRVAFSLDADIYHAHDANALPVGWAAAFLRRAKLIYDAHEFERDRNWGRSNLPPIVRKYWALPERLFIRRADAVITVSGSIARALAAIYRIKEPALVRNCPPLYVETSKTDRIRDANPAIGADQPIVLYQGRIAANRGLRQFIQGTMGVPNAVAVLLGNGPLRSELEAWVEENDWSERVFFMGYVPQNVLLRYTASADIGVSLIENACLSYYYSLPNKLFEYQQAGLPVIASNFPEMSAIVGGYDLGELVDPDDVPAITAAIHRLLSDPARYAQLRENAHKAAQRFNWEAESRTLLEVYDEVRKG